MKPELSLAATLVLITACNGTEADETTIETDGDSGSSSTSTGAASAETESSGTELECGLEGDPCENCCSGLGCNFEGLCSPCTPEGEVRPVDGAGCCEGLGETQDGRCTQPADCQPLNPDLNSSAPDGYILDCLPEACLSSRELVLRNDSGMPGLECSGPGGSSECAATGGALQQFGFSNEEASLTVRFDASVVDDYSTEGFTDAFDSVAGQVWIPTGATGESIIAFIGPEAPAALLYTDGRLQFTVTLDLRNPFISIQSEADDCVSDDVGGECACFYEALGLYDVVVDLMVEAP